MLFNSNWTYLRFTKMAIGWILSANMSMLKTESWFVVLKWQPLAHVDDKSFKHSLIKRMFPWKEMKWNHNSFPWEKMGKLKPHPRIFSFNVVHFPSNWKSQSHAATNPNPKSISFLHSDFTLTHEKALTPNPLEASISFCLLKGEIGNRYCAHQHYFLWIDTRFSCNLCTNKGLLILKGWFLSNVN